MAIRIIVADVFLEHGASVKNAISTGYGSDISAQISIVPVDLGEAIVHAQASGSIAVVHSYTGVESHVAEAQVVYPTILCFMPLGSNSFVELTALSDIPVIVTSGAGTTQNDTAYGDGLEFWDSPDFVSSNSNGVICGKMLYIKDTLGLDWLDVRRYCRATTSQRGQWNKFNGYGQIDVAAALAYIDVFSFLEIPYAPVVMNLSKLIYVYTS